MSHDQLIRHAVDAARAGNPALAKVHLQKAAETAPDDPTVWLWMSWLADSPVSMIQCLELVKRHDDYREIAESGLAFARGLARFDCDVVGVPSPQPEGHGDAECQVACLEEQPEEPRNVTVEADRVEEISDPPTASENIENFEIEIEPVVDEAEGESPEAVDCRFEEGSVDDTELVEADEECEAKAQDVLAAKLEAVAQETLGPADEEFPPSETDAEPSRKTQARWDGIDLLSRTADAVADELKADAITDDTEETLSFPEGESDLPDGAESLGGSIEANSEVEIHETAAEPPSTGEGSSWFDYWLPKEQRLAGSTSDSENDVSDEVIASDEPVSEFSETDEVIPQPEPVQNLPQSVAVPNIAPDAPLLEIVGESPLDTKTSASDDEGSESSVDESLGNEPSIIVEAAEVVKAVENAGEHPLPEPSPLPTTAASARPIPVREPVNAWRAARTDWFSANSQAPNAIIPHKDDATPPALPPFAVAATSPDAMLPSPVQETESGLKVPAGLTAQRPADQTMFDAEPTPPAVIDPAGRGSITGSGPVPTGAEIITQLPEPHEAPADPEKEPSEDSTSRPRQNLDSSSRRTVLVVDDSPTVRKLVEMSLTRSGFRVVHAFDGVAAIKEIARQDPSLILMDASMPRLDGYQLCKLVKKHESTRHIPVVMLTGKEGVFDKLRGKLVGCSGYIAKPFSPDELVTAVGRFLQEPAAQ